MAKRNIDKAKEAKKDEFYTRVRDKFCSKERELV